MKENGIYCFENKMLRIYRIVHRQFFLLFSDKKRNISIAFFAYYLLLAIGFPFHDKWNALYELSYQFYVYYFWYYFVRGRRNGGFSCMFYFRLSPGSSRFNLAEWEKPLDNQAEWAQIDE